MILVTIVVKEPFVSDANQLLGAVGYREEDKQTFGEVTHTDGVVSFSLASGLLDEEAVDKIVSGVLTPPDWSVDMEGAGRAAEAVVVFEAGEDGEEERELGDITVLLGTGLQETVRLFGLFPLLVFEEEEQEEDILA